MRIEGKPKSLDSPHTQPAVDTSWETFFSHFSSPPSKEEQAEILQNMVQHLSHIIYQNMQRMVNIYKQMKEQ
jgi:hypothetical protein